MKNTIKNVLYILGITYFALIIMRICGVAFEGSELAASQLFVFLGYAGIMVAFNLREPVKGEKGDVGPKGDTGPKGDNYVSTDLDIKKIAYVTKQLMNKKEEN